MSKRPFGCLDPSVSLSELMPAVEGFSLDDVTRHLQLAVENNAVDALSVLLSSKPGGVPFDDTGWLHENASHLLDLAEKNEAAEACLMVLNQLEARRKQRVESDLLEAGGSKDLKAQQARFESWCAPGTTPLELLRRAAAILPVREYTPEDGGRLRLARVLMLQCSRVQTQKEDVLKSLKPERWRFEAGEGDDKVSVLWPPTPKDYTEEMCAAKECKVGGSDLSEGAEAVPVEWVNHVDTKTPKPFVYVRRCIAAGVHPDWTGRKAGKCNYDPKTATGASACTACLDPKFSGKPDGFRGQCNWACQCPALCAGRELARGSAVRLQVFKHKFKGWCLRTLSPIDKGAFIMEYVAERVTPAVADKRLRLLPDTDIYLMETSNKGNPVKLDALHVRNIAAFASFACRSRFANMDKLSWLSDHWDKAVTHAVFVARRDIQPGEELTYLRQGEEPKADSVYNCSCGDADCSKKF